MRLGLVLSHIAKYIMPYRYRGKHRIVKKPKMRDLLNMKSDFEREEQNMLLLRHPYLTVEQSRGHMHRVDKNKRFFDNISELQRQKFFKQVTFADHLAHMRVTEGWD